MRDTPQWRSEWLALHRDSDIIVTLLDGTPVRAEYRVLSGGKFPVAYSFPENIGFNLV